MAATIHRGATDAPSPTFEPFDLIGMDNLSVDLEVLRAMIAVAIDLLDSSPSNAQRLLFGALNQTDRADACLNETRRALLSAQPGASVIAAAQPDFTLSGGAS